MSRKKRRRKTVLDISIENLDEKSAFKLFISAELQKLRDQTENRISNQFVLECENYHINKLKQYRKTKEYKNEVIAQYHSSIRYKELTAEPPSKTALTEFQHFLQALNSEQEQENIVKYIGSVSTDSVREECIGYIQSVVCKYFSESLVLFEKSTDLVNTAAEPNKDNFYEAIERLSFDLQHGRVCIKRIFKSCSSSARNYIDYIARLMIEKDSFLKKYNADLIRFAFKEIRGKITENGEADKIKEAAVSVFTADRIKELLMENPRYSQQANKAVFEHTMLLREIPENYTDMYPYARQLKRHFILHLGPTNSGKTHDAIEKYLNSRSGIYLAPLRLLAYEIFEKANMEGVPCNMITGEEKIMIPFANHISSTVEMAALSSHFDIAVIDECQMISDRERGGAWTTSILGICADEIHICAAVHAKSILINLIELCNDTYEIIEHKRSVPLIADHNKFSFPESVRKNDALIVFSKNSVIACAAKLQENGIKTSVVYGALPYEVRRSEVDKFISGKTDVVVATDAIGMGMNLPAERVVFLETSKFDGLCRRPLKCEEVQQIAGRAGRMGLYDVGYYTSEYKTDKIEKLVNDTPEEIKYARLKFPETLLGLDMELSTIIERWNALEDKSVFIKEDMKTELGLCRALESRTDGQADKQLIYNFITIPFDEENNELRDMWFDLFLCEYSDIDQTVSYCQAFFKAVDICGMSLNELEALYKKCDLLCCFLDRFNYRAESDYALKLKKDISVEMMSILSRQALKKRKCRNCGCELPWNSPYYHLYCKDCYIVLNG